MAQVVGSWMDLSWSLRAAAVEAPFPFPREGVAEGRGRGARSGRQTAACHKEF